MVLAVIGARLYHVIHLWGFYSQHPDLIAQIWNGGLGIPGGVAGGALGMWIATRSRGLNSARWMDIFAPALLFGQVIGRLGNFVNQELYGPPISECGDGFPPCLPWGIQIDQAHRADTPWTNLAQYPVIDPVRADVRVRDGAEPHRRPGHPVRHSPIRATPLRRGCALLYMVWYGAVRTVLKTYRVNNWTILGLPTAMWIGIIGFLLAGSSLILRHRRGSGPPMIRPPDAEAAPAPAPATQPEASAG